MNVLVSIDKNYIRYFKVTLFSLSANTDAELCVYVLHCDLSADDVADITETFPKVKFVFIEMDDEYFRGFPTVKRYPYTVYYRIFAPLLLPETVERILYIDCDLIVHNDVSEFYNTPFDGNLFIACTHNGRGMKLFNCIRLGRNKDYVYMNTGVMLMNVKALRAQLDIDKIRKYTIRNKWRLALYDQDILYSFYGNQVKLENPLVYNLTDRHFNFYNAKHKDKIDGAWVDENNVIFHYIGRRKPWKDNYMGKFAEYYKEYERRAFEKNASEK